MKILITGANGFLGFYLSRLLLQEGHEVIATGKGECRLPYAEESNFVYVSMDFTDPFAAHDVFEKYKPGYVVHAGAISKPDECELNQWNAFQVNVESTLTLLMNAEEHQSFFLFLSTDFIFDGEDGMYSEEDAPAPVNYYGRTKLEAEEAVREYSFQWAIVRTVLVYGKAIAGRPNILSVVREKLEKGETYNVVDDQVRTPTYIEDLATGILRILERKATGVYHIAGNEVMTPYTMACQLADALRLDKSLLRRVTAADFSQAAKRPLKTGFRIDKAKRELGFEPISFQEGLKKSIT